MKGLGTLINVAAVLAGSGAGLWLGSRLSPRTREVLTGGLGVVTVLIGLDMARATGNILIVLGSVLLGGLVGTALDLEGRLEALGRAVERALTAPRSGAFAVAAGAQPRAAADGAPPPDGRLARGFVAASLLFCVGPMTFLGSIQDGLTGDYQLLAVKATLDGFASLAMAPALGAGVALAAVTVLGVQGGLTLLAGFISPLINEAMLNELTAAGGVLVVMIGLGLLEIKRLPVANFLPALVFAPVIAALAAR
ncbi:protein of unknown function DUF554 [Thermaerobacter marianensis DSM 12885]|uniref:DUF554 domain-containing protein n=1 Tax=Thermaerobacter marianensis (strain ATCC 700841 / DSM 12885 / JCM 10246 / 7p75a) TaxID=644966 RepID=E6SHG3_THEM7|nr:DUF554 domain-containing protein [Thermaerobacter marianensis]ADU50727.1 protein of unknown function DUF554 [Thermaerobacter marianensis DSM 12885]